MKRKLSIHDIARELKTSAATVSFVLNGKGGENRISQEMEKKILAYVKEVGYQPNLVARSLRTGKSHILVMLVDDISDPFFSKVSRIVEINAYQMGYKIFYASTENDCNKTKELIRVFRERRVDGFIMAPPPGIASDVQSLLDDGVPIVMFDRFLPEIQTTNIIVDNHDGAFTATKHLIENGYLNVGIVMPDSEQPQIKERLAGYCDAIKGVQEKSHIYKLPYNQDHADVATKVNGFLEENRQVDALLFATNRLAIGGLQAIKARQLRIPEDMGVVGFDDNTHFSLFSPPITAVAQPVELLAEQAVNHLIKLLSPGDQNPGKETIVLKTSLVIRQSSVTSKSIAPAKIKKDKTGEPVPE